MKTKEKILQVSLNLFARNGYEAVSVSDIAGELGLTKSALYKHYTNKRDIFDSIVKKMEEQDYENAKYFDMPVDLFSNMPEQYRKTAIERISAYSIAQFIYWTEDPFASAFRKMISIERYRDEYMEKLFQQYLGIGPLDYLTDLFRECLEETGKDPYMLALEFYSTLFMLVNIYDSSKDKSRVSENLTRHIVSFVNSISEKEYIEVRNKIEYPLSAKYSSPELMAMIMGPNPIKLEEELLSDSLIRPGSVVCDLGSGNGLTSVFMAKEYGYRVYASDLWSDPEDNRKFFASQGLSEDQITPVKADAMALPFEKEFFDAVVSVDSYNYFGRDESYLDDKLLPFVKSGGYIYIAVPGMKRDCHDNLPPELLLSWTPEQMDFMHDTLYWQSIMEKAQGAELVSIREMQSNEEVWDDWLKQENPYAVGDRKSMNAGAGKYLNFIQIVLKKK